MVETMGSGACFLDYDDDGDDDLYLVQGAPLPGFESHTPLRNALFRNEGPGADGMVRFRDVTQASATGDGGWGMGCAVADVDGDGDVDLLVTNLGPDVLLRNDGDGSFTDVTADAGVGDPRWSASAAFADADGDGDLDLYVTRYVDFSVDNHHPCGALVEGMVSYCHPQAYEPVPDSFYRNRGDGTFELDDDLLVPGTPGNGLGLVWSDLDGDGRLDLYVANDSSPNFLFLAGDGGSFREVGLLRGVSVNEDGRSEAGMGVESADLDGDGWFDLFVTHLEMETNTLYRNLGDGRFLDRSLPSGVGRPSLRFVGFGTVALDFDLDGDLDLAVANGHILDDAERYWDNVTYAQPAHLLENDGRGRFREVGADHGDAFERSVVGRGLAAADLENDGDLDLLLTVSRGRPLLLLASGAAGSWVELDLRQAGSNHAALGSRVTFRAGEHRSPREVRSASSYLSQNTRTLHAGLGDANALSLEVRWPDGARQRHARLPTNRRYRLARAVSPR